MRLRTPLAGTVWALAMAASLAAGAPGEEAAPSTRRWERWERTFTARCDPTTELLATFTAPSGRERRVRGFWDGGEVWRVRFMPDETGTWHYRTSSRPAHPALDGREGGFTCRPSTAATRFLEHGAIRVAASGHHFEHADGTPFFWLVDTAWNGALKSSREDWDRYLSNRAAKGFTGVQFVVTQWRTAYTNAEGQVAYSGFDDIEIHPEFFRRIDERVEAVNAKGLLAVPVLLWTLGQRQHNPGQLPEEQAIRLARYMVARYGAHHVAFFLPGDGRYFGEGAERWKRIGRGVFDLGDHPPVFLHPQGMQWPYDAFRGEEWLSAFGYQSGHGDDERTVAWLTSGPPAEKWREEPVRPVINLEPPYEDHIAYQSRERHTAYTVRRALYWGLLNAPAAGTSYGAHGVWSWESAPREPQEHGGTGVAKPWFEAMDLEGSFHVKHLSDLFASIPWGELRPDPELVERPATAAREPSRMHLVYTRDRDGQAVLYVDGVRMAARRVRGDCSGWDPSFRLALANELTRDRAWLGEYHRVALFDRALGAGEVAQRFREGAGGEAAGALVLYAFAEGGGDRVRDRSGASEPADLKIEDPSAVRWLAGGGLAVHSPVVIASSGDAAARVTRAVSNSGAFSVEAWVRPADLIQAGPARIVTLSRDPAQRNFTLGQKGSAFEVRFRTTETSANGEPSLSTPGGGEAFRYIGAARSRQGDLALLYLPAGGEVRVRAERLRDGRRAEWFDPRTGERRPAERIGSGTFRAPGGDDWVLLLR